MTRLLLPEPAGRFGQSDFEFSNEISERANRQSQPRAHAGSPLPASGARNAVPPGGSRNPLHLAPILSHARIGPI